MARNFFNYINYSYSGGLNNSDEADQIREDQSSTLKNAYIDKRGTLVKRNGALLLGDDTGTTRITGGTGWIEDDGTKWNLRTTGVNLQYLTGGAWTNLDTGFTSDLQTEFIAANNKMYILNGTDNIHSFDGTSTTLNSCLTDLGSSIPKAKYGIFWKNYMFVCGDANLSGTDYPSRVYFSNLADPDTWTTGTDYFDVNISDGQPITGIKTLGELLIIFKRRSYYIMSGSTPADWRISGSVNNLQSVDGAIGCVSHRSIVQVGNDVWFMSDDGMRSVRRNEDASTPQTGIVSAWVDGTMKSMNKSSLDLICATLFNKRVYIAYPTSADTYNTEVLVADTRISTESITNPHPWVKYTGWNVNCWWQHIPSSESVLYYGEASSDSKAFQAEIGTNDNSATIDFQYASPLIDLRQPGMKKTARFIKVYAEAAGDYNIQVSSSLDGSSFTTHGSLNLTTGGSLWNSAVWDTDVWSIIGRVEQKYPIQRASEKIMIKFSNNAADEEIKLYPYTLAIKTKKIK